MQNVLPCPCHGTKSSLGLTNEKINDRLVCYSVYLRGHKDEVVCCLSLQLIGLFVSVSGGSASCRSVLQISGDYCVLHFCRFAFKVWLFLAVPCGNMQRSVVGFWLFCHWCFQLGRQMGPICSSLSKCDYNSVILLIHWLYHI